MTKLSHHEAQRAKTTGTPGDAFLHDLCLSGKLSVETRRFVLIGLILPASFWPLLFYTAIRVAGISVANKEVL